MRRILVKYLALILAITIASIVFSKLSTSKKEEVVSKYNETIIVTQPAQPQQPQPTYIEYDFLKRYPQMLNCKNEYKKWDPNLVETVNSSIYNISTAASDQLKETRLTRAIIVYFPIQDANNFEHELRWLYRSWTHMMQYEPTKWRTDLVIFVENDKGVFNRTDFFLNDLNCRFENLRRSSEDKPMCTLLNYVALEKRDLGTTNEKSFNTSEELYAYLLKDVNIFKSEFDEFDTLRKLMKKEISRYRYLNSILMALEGYEYFKAAGYDFLVRSDMDVFLAPMFATWAPRYCNDFNVGGGAFSTDFNEKRLSRAAERIHLRYAFERNLGSTWYSTPAQIRLVSYLTLFGMVYIAREEFSEPEREGKIGVQLWPYWHYGVLLLYGQSLGLNHLIATNQLHVVSLKGYLDYPSANTRSIHSVLHIHVFHGDDMFSKFAFKMGKYDAMNVTDSDEIKQYALRMALEGKRFSCNSLYTIFQAAIQNKN